MSAWIGEQMMVQLRFPRRTKGAALLAGAVVAIGLISALALTGFVALPFGAGQGGLLVGVGLAVAPLAVILAARWPFLPFCLYAAILPLDGLNLGFTRNLPHLLGLLATVVLALRLAIRRSPVPLPRALVAWTVLLLWMVCSLAWTENFSLGAQLSQQVAANLALAVLLAVTPFTLGEFQAVIASVVVGGIGSAGYAIRLYESGSTFAHQTDAGARVFFGSGSTYDLDPNFFAAALVLPTIVAIIAALRTRKLPLKLLLTATTIVIMLGIIVSGSRGAFIALGVGVLYLFLRGRYLVQLSLLAVLGGLASLALPIIWTRFNDPNAGQASGRFEAWPAGWYAFRHHWFLGNGIGGYRDAYEQAYLHIFQSGNFHTWSQDPHNLLFQTGVELGGIGLMIVAVAWFVQFRTLRYIPRASPLYDMRCAVEAATAALFVSSLSMDLMTMKWTWLCFSMAYVTRNTWLCNQGRFGGALRAPPAPAVSAATPAVGPGIAHTTPVTR
jgi:hypothetical protein